MGSYAKLFFDWRGEGGNRLIASEKLIKVYLLYPVRYRLNKQKVPMEKKYSTARLIQKVYKRTASGNVCAFVKIAGKHFIVMAES